MTSVPLSLFIIAVVFVAPHMDIKTANKYAWVNIGLGLAFWGIEIAVS